MVGIKSDRSLQLDQHVCGTGQKVSGSEHIVNMSSLNGVTRGVAVSGDYAATKFRCRRPSEILKAEMEPVGITVVLPGLSEAKYHHSESNG